MIKGLVGMILASIIFAATLFLIFHFIGVLAIIVGIIAAGFIIGAAVVFILLLVFGFILFFATFYYLIEKKPTVQTNGNYTLSMEKGKGEEEK
jgi:membrane protein implicated in regulation of membrane protease activity